MGELKSFSERLKTLGIKHNTILLVNCARELIDLIDLFDIKTLEKRFQTFPDLMGELIQKLERSNDR